MDNCRMNKRASIPVTLVVILVVALLMFSLFLFAMNAFKTKQGLGDSFKKVQEYNVKAKGNKFAGSTEPAIVRDSKNEYLLFGKDILSISITRNSFSS